MLWLSPGERLPAVNSRPSIFHGVHLLVNPDGFFFGWSVFDYQFKVSGYPKDPRLPGHLRTEYRPRERSIAPSLLDLNENQFIRGPLSPS